MTADLGTEEEQASTELEGALVAGLVAERLGATERFSSSDCQRKKASFWGGSGWYAKECFLKVQVQVLTKFLTTTFSTRYLYLQSPFMSSMQLSGPVLCQVLIRLLQVCI